MPASPRMSSSLYMSSGGRPKKSKVKDRSGRCKARTKSSPKEKSSVENYRSISPFLWILQIARRTKALLNTSKADDQARCEEYWIDEAKSVAVLTHHLGFDAKIQPLASTFLQPIVCENLSIYYEE